MDDQVDDVTKLLATVNSLFSYSLLASEELETQHYAADSKHAYFFSKKNPYLDVQIITCGVQTKNWNLPWLLTKTLRSQTRHKTQAIITQSNNLLSLWDIETGTCIKDYDAGKQIYSFETLPLERIVMLSEYDVTMLDIGSELILHQIDLNCEFFKPRMYVTYQGVIIITSERCDKMYVWQPYVNHAQVDSHLIENAYSFRHMVQMSDDIIVFGGNHRSMTIIDKEDFTVSKTVWVGDHTTAMVGLENGNLVTGHKNGKVKIWNRKFGCIANYQYYPNPVTVLVDLRSHLVSAVAERYEFNVLDIPSGKTTPSNTKPFCATFDQIIDLDQSTFAAISFDIITIWNVYGKCLRTIYPGSKQNSINTIILNGK
jgi:WD40 repeat protein